MSVNGLVPKLGIASAESFGSRLLRIPRDPSSLEGSISATDPDTELRQHGQGPQRPCRLVAEYLDPAKDHQGEAAAVRVGEQAAQGLGGDRVVVDGRDGQAPIRDELGRALAACFVLVTHDDRGEHGHEPPRLRG
jgi:hypothetical protein